MTESDSFWLLLPSMLTKMVLPTVRRTIFVVIGVLAFSAAFAPLHSSILILVQTLPIQNTIQSN